MAALITLDQAKLQCRIPPDDDTFDDELDMKRTQASAIVTDYLSEYLADLGSPAWDEDTDPTTEPQFALVQAAILEVVTNLWRHRGDESPDGPLTTRVVNMLRSVKTPAFG